MRFAKRNRGWLAGRRLFGDGRDADSGGVASEERSALLDNETDTDEGVLGAPTPSGVGDPTHRLLTALGRFQRQVSRAEGGAPQAQWCDECMNQLIVGIELAMTQGWGNVTQALTDTARVLHSYERLDRAQQCVPFLQDSYEILCLMVGDLIVDSVRSGVMQKWRERFQRAVEEMQRLGIPLVEDDAEEEETAAALPAKPATPAGTQSRVEQASLFELGDPEVALEEESAEVRSVPSDGPGGVSAFAEPDLALSPAEDTGNLPALGELLGEETGEEETGGTVEEPALEETDVFEPVEEAREEIDGEEGTGEVSDLPALAEPQQEVTPFEEPEAIAAAAPSLQEGPRPLDLVSNHAPEPAPIPAAPPSAGRQSEAGAAEALLQHTRQAICSGNVADAKLLALELAINMARLETKRVEEQVSHAEALLTENEAAIAETEETVRQEEQGVATAEERVAEREHELSECRTQLSDLHERATAVQGEIDSIDEEIRALELRRQTEVERLAAVRREQEEALANESRIQTEIEHLNDAVQTAREALEEARGAIGRLREERTQRDADLKSAMLALEQRKQSVDQIARTIEAIREAAGGASGTPAQAEAPDELF